MSKALQDVSIVVPSIGEIGRSLSLQAGFNSAVVVCGATFLGLAAGAIGTFTLLRGRALISDALAHSALPGLALGYLVSVHALNQERSLFWLLLGATLSGILGVCCVQLISRHTRLAEDAAIGIVLSVFFGVGIVLLSLIQGLGAGQVGGLQHYIYGQTAALRFNEAVLTGVVSLGVIALCLALIKEFRLVCFDSTFAASLGWSVSAIDLLMMGAVVLVTIIGLQTVGMLLIVALLIIPPTAARFWTERLSAMMWISALIGALSGYFGAAASSLLPRLPAGAIIVSVSGVIFLCSFLFAPQRGLLAAAMRRFKLSLRVASDHLLREIWQVLQRNNAQETAQDIAVPKNSVATWQLPLLRSWSPLRQTVVLLYLDISKVLKKRGKELILSEKGLSESRRVTRNHLLWEQYLLAYGQVAMSHVDYSADYVEHVLSPEIVAELEKAYEKSVTGKPALERG